MTADRIAGCRLAAAMLIALAGIQLLLGWLGPRGEPRVAGPIALLVLGWGLARARRPAAQVTIGLALLTAPLAIYAAWERGGAAGAVEALSAAAAPGAVLLLLVGRPDRERRRLALIVFAALVVVPSTAALLLLRC